MPTAYKNPLARISLLSLLTGLETEYITTLRFGAPHERDFGDLQEGGGQHFLFCPWDVLNISHPRRYSLGETLRAMYFQKRMEGWMVG